MNWFLIDFDEISTFLNFTIRRNLNLRHCSVRLQIFEVAWKYEQQQINNVWYSWSVITNFFDAQCRKYIYRMFKYVFQASSYFSARGDDTIIINTSLDCALQSNTVYLTSLGTDKKMSVDPCCRINRSKMHYGDIKGTKITMSVDLCVG